MNSSLTYSGLYYKCFTIVIYDHNDSTILYTILYYTVLYSTIKLRICYPN